eukprot:TRINITY_DN3195_c0_g3_i2.p1 TRINITY_DN3195_c0_g3~~TRINITY_DN3195_c0_g3_i2.p1  ORF type:complete len:615 (-),score=133.18 TRINITY_DN3195_c0_g3_i2:24-1868(-)
MAQEPCAPLEPPPFGVRPRARRREVAGIWPAADVTESLTAEAVHRHSRDRREAAADLSEAPRRRASGSLANGTSEAVDSELLELRRELAQRRQAREQAKQTVERWEAEEQRHAEQVRNSTAFIRQRRRVVIKIQSMVRGLQARKLVVKNFEEKLAKRMFAMSHDKLLLEVGDLRNHVFGKLMHTPDDIVAAVVRLQAWWRCILTRRSAVVLRVAAEINFLYERLDSSARVIQARYRGHRTRVELQNLIQTRIEADQVLRMDDWTQVIGHIIKLQRAHRSKMARRRLQEAQELDRLRRRVLRSPTLFVSEDDLPAVESNDDENDEAYIIAWTASSRSATAGKRESTASTAAGDRLGSAARTSTADASASAGDRIGSATGDHSRRSSIDALWSAAVGATTTATVLPPPAASRSRRASSEPDGQEEASASWAQQQSPTGELRSKTNAREAFDDEELERIADAGLEPFYWSAAGERLRHRIGGPEVADRARQLLRPMTSQALAVADGAACSPAAPADDAVMRGARGDTQAAYEAPCDLWDVYLGDSLLKKRARRKRSSSRRHAARTAGTARRVTRGAQAPPSHSQRRAESRKLAEAEEEEDVAIVEYHPLLVNAPLLV